MTNETVVALHGRAQTYGLLARLLAQEVDLDLLAALPHRPLPEQTGNEALDQGAALVNGYLEQGSADPGAARTELAVDFTHLFVVRGKETVGAAYPFESVYASTEGLTVSNARSEVLALYRAAGLVTHEGWNVGEDHVALELQFMQVLCERAAQAIEAGDDARATELLADQLAFLENHLLRWVPQFCEAMQRNARTDLYRGLARFVAGFLEEDRAALADALG